MVTFTPVGTMKSRKHLSKQPLLCSLAADMTHEQAEALKITSQYSQQSRLWPLCCIITQQQSLSDNQSVYHQVLLRNWSLKRPHIYHGSTWTALDLNGEESLEKNKNKPASIIKCTEAEWFITITYQVTPKLTRGCGTDQSRNIYHWTDPNSWAQRLHNQTLQVQQCINSATLEHPALNLVKMKVCHHSAGGGESKRQLSMLRNIPVYQQMGRWRASWESCGPAWHIICTFSHPFLQFLTRELKTWISNRATFGRIKMVWIEHEIFLFM